jgi:hypothetical protein
MSRIQLMTRSFFAVVFALLAWGCSEGRSSAPQLSAISGQHPATWMESHPAEYLKQRDQCRTCHGSTTDPAAAGGISKVSCFTCHPNGLGHPTGWAVPSQHGRLGAQLAPNTADPLAMAGFARCTQCHGQNYTGAIAPSCLTCHTKAPHPNKPWLPETGPTTLPSHTRTDVANAPVCAKCHLNGANSTRAPRTPAPAGTVPGCFNNTLCHS